MVELVMRNEPLEAIPAPKRGAPPDALFADRVLPLIISVPALWMPPPPSKASSLLAITWFPERVRRPAPSRGNNAAPVPSAVPIFVIPLLAASADHAECRRLRYIRYGNDGD
jgi:hypothetical protein